MVRVVIADDEEDMRLLLRVSLEVDGRFEVVGEASDGAEAIDVVTAERPDVVILDLRMPVMTGDEALPELRRRAPDTSVVVCSAHVSDDDAAALEDAGAACVLPKSVGTRALVQRVAEVAGLPVGG